MKYVTAMFDWIMRNKEWIFSGVGVVLIGWLVLAVRRFLFMRRTSSSLIEGATLREIIESPAVVSSSDIANLTSSLTPKQIIENIKALPLLQQQDAGKHYIGLAVKWDGELADARKIAENSVQLYILHGSSSTGFFLKVNPSDYPGLSLLKKGAHVEVDGLIEEAGAMWVTLNNAHIRF